MEDDGDGGEQLVDEDCEEFHGHLSQYGYNGASPELELEVDQHMNLYV